MVVYILDLDERTDGESTYTRTATVIQVVNFRIMNMQVKDERGNKINVDAKAILMGPISSSDIFGILGFVYEIAQMENGGITNLNSVFLKRIDEEVLS